MRRCAAAIARAVVAFLNAVLVGWFQSCFRPRPRPGSSCRDTLVSRDQQGEVLSDDEQGLGRGGRSCGGLDDGGSFDEEELRCEENYLESSDTISGTTAEFQNECCEISMENTDKCNNMPTDAPVTNNAFLSEANSSEGCISEEEMEHCILSSDLNIGDTQDLPGIESVPHSPFLEKTPFVNSKQKKVDGSSSPFPTPSVISDDMQTPGTICTSHRGSRVSGKCLRTQKLFIYPVLRPVEDKIYNMDLTEDTSPFPPNRRNIGADSFKKPKRTSSVLVAKPGLSKSPPFYSPNDNGSNQEREAQSKCQIDNAEQLDEGALPISSSDEKHAALSLSHWLRSSSTDKENQGDVNFVAGEKSYDDTERPDFLASHLNWDVENPTPRLPKTWDGNGIPNTTTKYKEEKRVTWHDTPFEERLLKVLSDDEFRPARVGRGKLFHP